MNKPYNILIQKIKDFLLLAFALIVSVSFGLGGLLLAIALPAVIFGGFIGVVILVVKFIVGLI